jgi:predicted CoA-binding protein
MIPEELILKFLDTKNVFAVVGASKDPEKYGHRVYKDLRSAGLNVYPVNPNAEEILGDKCYPSIEALPVKPDVVDVVVSPKITEETVRTCWKLGITKVWMQPGSESQAAINFCNENGMEVIYGICIMEERRKRHITKTQSQPIRELK